MGAAAFYDLDGTLVRTNLVHAFAFSARNQQGILKSAIKTAATLIRWLPMIFFREIRASVASQRSELGYQRESTGGPALPASRTTALLRRLNFF